MRIISIALPCFQFSMCLGFSEFRVDDRLGEDAHIVVRLQT